MGVCACVRACARVRVCVRACVRVVCACVRACVRSRTLVRACVSTCYRFYSYNRTKRIFRGLAFLLDQIE